MESTPDTVNYLIGGYVFFSVVMLAYTASLFLRWRSLKQEQETLEQLETK
jgi:hypothetical protein